MKMCMADLERLARKSHQSLKVACGVLREADGKPIFSNGLFAGNSPGLARNS